MGTNNNGFDHSIYKEDKNVYENLESFTAAGFKMLVEATKKSNNLPIGKSRDLYESCPSFHSAIEKQADYLLCVLSKMLKHISPDKCIQKKDDEDKFEMIVDSNDTLMEKVGILLDELSGIQKNSMTSFNNRISEPGCDSWNELKKRKLDCLGVTKVLNKILNQTKNIEKPQLKFKDKINNDSSVPFEPKITYKHNMLKPLSCIFEIDEYGLSNFTHPYEFELEKFKPSPEHLMHQSPIMYKPLEKTPLVLVTAPKDVSEMITDLEKYKELAVDLEHHSYRSFQGFTCLMQISTRDTDYIIDALSLRSDLEMLNKVFTNPAIVKVFHGADSDVLWLQRDLALYVVNMFDTYQAAKSLHFPKLSLAYLLNHYCNVKAQKQFQLADWRIRPLPQELLTYAREDTHYLLYIYDNLRNSLIEKDNNQTHLLKSVYLESAKICSKRYLKPVYEADGYLDLYRRSKKLFDNRQKFALQQLFEWRDTVARELDESYAYVLPDHMMLNISEVLPREAQGILACCNPVPALVRQNLMSLHQIILKAREQPLIKPVLEEQRFYKYTSTATSLDNPLRCPHDLNNEYESRDDLPVLFQGKCDENLDEKNLFCSSFYFYKPKISVFETSSAASDKVKLLLMRNKAAHITPYCRYKLSKKFSESVEIRSLNLNEKDNFKKEGKNAIFAPAEKSANSIEEVKNNFCENAGDFVMNEETELDDVKMNFQIIKQTPAGKERQIENKLKSPKEVDEISSNSDITSSPSEKKKPDLKLKERKKKRKVLSGSREKGFEPFDFNSVDFKKYQNPAITSEKKVRKKPSTRKRRKRTEKNNLGITI